MKNVPAISFGVVVSVASRLLLVLLECRLFSHINLPQAQNFTQMKPEARSSSGMDSDYCSVGRRRSVFSLSVEAATVAKEILIFTHNAQSTNFALSFSHFRVFIYLMCVRMCVGVCVRLGALCLFVLPFFHAPHVRHFVKIAFVTLPVPATNAPDNNNSSNRNSSNKKSKNNIVPSFRQSNNERYPSIIIINF